MMVTKKTYENNNNNKLILPLCPLWGKKSQNHQPAKFESKLDPYPFKKA